MTATSPRQLPDTEEVAGYLRERRNWGRWGEDDQQGAVNLITADKRVRSAALVRSGQAISLSRNFPTAPAPGNPKPAEHHTSAVDRPHGGGAATDYYGINYHGFSCTHLDALCHVWDEEGMWNGRDPRKHIQPVGVSWGGVEQWSDGIITRGVLLDVAGHRGVPYVSPDRPVHGWELAEVAAAQRVRVEPGDALVVHSGREAWVSEHPLWPEPTWLRAASVRPGLHASCLPFIRDHDIALVAWDMMDCYPSGYDLPWTVHGALCAYGVALVDNALLTPLAEACRRQGRYEFLFLVAPLRVVGGTGSPVNPLAVL